MRVFLATLILVFASSCEDEHQDPTQAIAELGMSCEEITALTLQEAIDIADLDGQISDIPTDPAKAIEIIKTDLTNRGFHFLDKPEGGLLSRYTTTVPNAVFLGEGFGKKHIIDQAILWGHERVHANTEQRLAPDLTVEQLWNLGLFYGRPSGRLAMEGVAYVAGAYLAARFGRSHEWILVYLDRRAGALHTDYVLPTVSKDCIRNIMDQILMYYRDNGYA